MENTGKPYEELTRTIFEQIVNQTAARTIEVRTNVVLQGKTTTHQIDVFWKFEVGGVEYQTVVQCKDWNKPVDQGELILFKGVLDDIPGQPRGVFVTRTGYQRGARDFAEAHGIELYELCDADPGGKIRKVVLNMRLLSPRFSSWKVIPDEEWHAAERVRLGIGDPPSTFQTNLTQFEDESGSPVISLADLSASMPGRMRSEAPEVIRHDFGEPTFIRSGHALIPRLKIVAIEATVSFDVHEEERSFYLPDVPAFILRNVVRGDSATFDGHLTRMGDKG